ncbi:acylphosphatase [Candidatus Bathyarchaeota archaeon]|nr:acylphosphatase [Candidatus Bathyarchaeota archaeon]NIV44192.1 acylphosphatase [Candidatus Bathyarchaeota archaeon]NIW10513.1 acylphosphatase [Gammaproteobacteria bacterium]
MHAPVVGVFTLKARAHVYVSGRVQGVFFRFETQDLAVKYKVTGWVQNLPDGRVEAVFEGEKERVERLIEFCRRGPLGARVAKVDVSWETYTGRFQDFKVRYGYWRY